MCFNTTTTIVDASFEGVKALPSLVRVGVDCKLHETSPSVLFDLFQSTIWQLIGNLKPAVVSAAPQRVCYAN